MDTGLGHLAAAQTRREPMQGMMLLDFCNYLVDDILVKVDRASMAASLEVRSPFLDYRVVELAWRLPLALRYGDGGGKCLLRRPLGRYVSANLTDRPKKGFSVSVGDWLNGPTLDWAQELLNPAKIREEGVFNVQSIHRIWKQHRAGWQDHSDVLWSILVFQSWRDAL